MNEVINKLTKEFKENDTIVLALSGGPDSMALLDILIKVRKAKPVKIICVHINHKLRKESDQEERMVKEYCTKNNIICDFFTINHYDKSNTENQARIKRYQFLEKSVKKCQAKYLLTAHHGDDLIETILMRLTRGSSHIGYQGFKEKTQKENYILYRPLITKTKEEILNYCKKNKIPYSIDSSNQSDKYTRNRYRKYILPVLKKEDKNIHQKFYKFSETIQKYEDHIQKEVTEEYSKVVKKNKIIIKEYLNTPQLIQKKILEKYLYNNYKEKINLINDKHTQNICKIIKSQKPNLTLNLPNNLIIVKKYQELEIKQKNKQENYNQKLKENQILPNNHQIKIVKNSSDTSNNTTYLNTKEIKLPLYIRTKQEGDKIEIKNLKGRKKIKDIFIDEKIPQEQRKLWPILVDSQNQVIWVPGLKKSKFDKTKDKNYDIIIEYI